MPPKPAGAYNVAVARVRQIKRIVNGTQANLQSLAKTGAIEAAAEAGDAQLQAELTALAQTLTDVQERMEAVRARSMAIVGEATTRLADRLTPGVAFTLSRQGETETRST